MGKFAINNSGTISVSEGIPNTFKVSGGAVIGGGSTLSEAEALEKGFFPVVMPDDYDERIHNLSQIFFVSAEQIYTYTKTNKTWSESLADLKANKIANLKSQANRLLEPTDWYIIRKVELETAIPSSVTTARATIKTNVDTIESEINALTSKASVVVYGINLE
tara:strand:+ start:3345 stop:3833 length:489 start_codon:yes stop_codon:yes gene_type:complete